MGSKNVAAQSSNSSRCWYRKPGVICLSVTSDGTTGKQWIERLRSRGYPFDVFDFDNNRESTVLRSESFKPTNGVTTEIEILLPRIWNYRRCVSTKEIRIEASRRKLWKPKAEVACLMLETLTYEDLEAMGLHNIIVAHEPIAFADERFLLCVTRDDSINFGHPVIGLGTFPVRPLYEWDRYCAFAFAVPPSRRKRG